MLNVQIPEVKTVRIENGWAIMLTALEVKEFEDAHYRLEGYNQIISSIQGNNPTDEVLIRMGKASALLKDLGANKAAECIPELVQNPNMQFTWDCDFINKILNIKLV